MLPAMFAGLLMSQGETTSAIVGAVADVTGGAIVAASVTAISTETRSKRTAKTDDCRPLQLSPAEARAIFSDN